MGEYWFIDLTRLKSRPSGGEGEDLTRPVQVPSYNITLSADIVFREIKIHSKNALMPIPNRNSYYFYAGLVFPRIISWEFKEMKGSGRIRTGE